MKDYYYSHKLDAKYKAYRHHDSVRIGVSEPTIERDKAVSLMMQPCFYCEVPSSHGLDRKDSSRGHSEDNVVPCCEKCNNILGDLSFDAKLLLKDGLKKIRNAGLFDTWEIPTKRRKKNDG
jgi:hypothetical protein